jgi:YbgC/YbaW family acyl-CoA thioester hydrolase
MTDDADVSTDKTAKIKRYSSHEYSVLIREGDLDTFGHVNNAVYLRLFEEARWDLITAGGYGLREVQEKKVGPTVLEVRLQFRREIRLREQIKIVTELTSVARKTMTLRQAMLNSQGEEACIADFVIGLFDLQARRLIEPTDEWKRVLGLHE